MSKVNSLEGDSDRIRHWDTTGTAVWAWFLLFSRKPCSLRVIEWLICILEGETVIFELKNKMTNKKNCLEKLFDLICHFQSGVNNFFL